MQKSDRALPRGGAARLTSLLLLLGLLPLAGAELKVTGLNWLGNRAAGQRLHELLGGLTGPTLDANAIEDGALVLLASANEDGYLEARVIAQVRFADGREAQFPLDARLEPPLPRPLAATVVTLKVERGRRFTLQEVSFSGLTAIPKRVARAFFVGEDRLLAIASENIYSPGRWRASLGNLEEALRQQGYVNAVVTAPEPQIDPGTGRVKVAIQVQEGPRWIVEALTFAVEGDTVIPAGAIPEGLGQPWNSNYRLDTATAIRRWYLARGYPDVEVKLQARTRLRPDGIQAVSIRAEVKSGPAVRVGAIRFTGNRYTREATLRRFVTSAPGAPLDPVGFNDTQARLSLLGIFRGVDLRYEPIDDHTRDAVFALTEGRRQELSLIAGYGSYEQFRGGIEWRHFNLLGRAHSGILRMGQSIKSSQGDYTYSIPELFGTAQTGTASVFGLKREELSFVHEEFGANVTVLWPLSRLGFSLATGYTFKHVLDLDNSLATRASDQSQVDVGSLKFGLVRDRRDNQLRPRRGYRVSLQTELADHALGGDAVYQQFVLAASYHTAWGGGRWLHLGFAHGLVTTFGAVDDSRLPVSVRFFPGGEDSLRGYRKGEAAPRAENGKFVGAKSYLQLSSELEQALTQNWSVVAFVDSLGSAAQLADYPFTAGLHSVGLGARYQTIIGPIRAEYGRNLNPRPTDPKGTLLISIGFPF